MQGRAISTNLRGQTITVRTEPGVIGYPEVDPAAALLADAIEVSGGGTVLDLACGAGVVGAGAALAGAGAVVMADRSVLAMETARRTAEANHLINVRVVHSDGLSHLRLNGPVDVVAVRAPRERLAALQLIWDGFQALRPGGRLYLAGANDEGVKTALRHVEELFGGVTLLAYRKGCRVGVAEKRVAPAPLPEAFASDWLDHGRFHEFTAEVRGGAYRVCSRPGVFAWDRVDEGARALIETMVIERGQAVLELGCGNGMVGAVAATLSGGGAVHMVDADIVAVESARRTVARNALTTCTVHAGNAADPVRHLRFDRVVINPPFHTGKATRYDAAARFIDDAAAVLRRDGRLYLVANRFLPYERHVQRAFGNVGVAYEAGGYKVLSAVKSGGA